MRIGIDCRLWNETGVGRYIRNLVWELQNVDTTNEYILFITSQDYQKTHSHLSARTFQLRKTDIHWHSVAEQIKFPQLLYRENLDLMHFPYFSLPIFYNRPFIVTIHDLILNHFPTGKASTLPYPLYRLKRFGYDAVMQHAVKNSQKIIVPLNAVKDDLVETLGVKQEKIAVTYEGSSTLTSGKLNIQPKNKNYFLYVGNAYPHKNLDFLLQAFGEFRKATNDAELILVGKEDYFYKRLQGQITKENVTGVTVLHNVSDEELFSLYAQATAFISASKMEGFGLPPLEAMASSCPVLVSDIPSFREVCGDVAFYFDPYETNSLKEKTQVVYNLSQKEKMRHIHEGLARVKDFSWKSMAKETQAIYESSVSIR